MIITAIHQPSFFPWLGLLDKIAKANYFVFLDHASVNKGSYQYRNLFYCNGEGKYLTLPVDIGINKPINELIFKNDKWVVDHLEKLKNYYRKANHFQNIYSIIEDFYAKNYQNRPVDVIANSMKLMFSLFNIVIETEFSSRLNCKEKKGDLVLEICKKVNTDIYLSGRGAKEYMDEHILDAFAFKGIGIAWHNFKHPVYEQFSKVDFVSGLSSLDLLFFQGIEKSRDLFWNIINTSETNE